MFQGFKYDIYIKIVLDLSVYKAYTNRNVRIQNADKQYKKRIENAMSEWKTQWANEKCNGLMKNAMGKWKTNEKHK